MSFQSMSLLNKLRKAQIDENSIVVLDNGSAGRIHEENQEYIVINLQKYENSLDSIIDHLVLQGYLVRLHPRGPLRNLVQVTHSGWHYWQARLLSICKFLFTSILVPVIVAFLTTLISLWVTGFLTP